MKGKSRRGRLPRSEDQTDGGMPASCKWEVEVRAEDGDARSRNEGRRWLSTGDDRMRLGREGATLTAGLEDSDGGLEDSGGEVMEVKSKSKSKRRRRWRAWEVKMAWVFRFSTFFDWIRGFSEGELGKNRRSTETVGDVSLDTWVGRPFGVVLVGKRRTEKKARQGRG